jgi:hypothetical protein
MKILLKIILITIAFVIVSFISMYAYNWLKFGYHVDMRNYRPYFWIFTDTAKKEINTKFFVSYSRRTDIINAFSYKENCQILIWEFKDLKMTQLKDIGFKSDNNLSDIKFKTYEILNKNSYPEIRVNFGSFFKSTMNVNFDQYSKILWHFDGRNYRGVKGILHKMLLSDINEKNLVTIDYFDQTRYFTGLIYKGHDSFFLILITSKGTISDDIMNIFNLN